MSATSTYDEVAAQIRLPPASPGRDDRELIRKATLAASSHNTQPWTFAITPDWVDAGRAYQRFALQAEVFDIRTAFVNQPIEVPGLRSEFESWLGLSDERAQLAVRFGHGPRTPNSLRRPVDDVARAEAS